MAKDYEVAARVDALVAAHLTLPASTALTLSASFQTVPGLSAVLAVAHYHIRGLILLNPTVSGGTPAYQVSASGGLTAPSSRMTITELYASNQVQVADWFSVPGSLTSAGAVGAGLADRLVTFDGYLEVSTAGTLNIQASLSSGSGQILKWGSYLEVQLLS